MTSCLRHAGRIGLVTILLTLVGHSMVVAGAADEGWTRYQQSYGGSKMAIIKVGKGARAGIPGIDDLT